MGLANAAFAGTLGLCASAQAVFAKSLDNPAEMLVQLSPTELNALGDWQDRVPDQRAAMPVHYSGLRYKESLRVKHLL